LALAPGKTANLTARQCALLDFAVKLTESPALLTVRDCEILRNHGFTDADVFDICEVTGFFNMTNRVAHGVAMRPNPEYHRQAR
jgi:uncharacterized peroxidase-related enzyme